MQDKYQILWRDYIEYVHDWANDSKYMDSYGSSPLTFEEWQDSQTDEEDA